MTLQGLAAVAIMLAALLAGCADRTAVSRPPDQDVPRKQEQPDTRSVSQRYSGGPAHALFIEATEAMAAGAYGRAEIFLERALRIAPGNPYYWHTMGAIKHRQGANPQALQFCLKAKSLAGRDKVLLELNDNLIEKIRSETAL